MALEGEDVENNLDLLLAWDPLLTQLGLVLV